MSEQPQQSNIITPGTKIDDIVDAAIAAGKAHDISSHYPQFTPQPGDIASYTRVIHSEGGTGPIVSGPFGEWENHAALFINAAHREGTPIKIRAAQGGQNRLLQGSDALKQAFRQTGIPGLIRASMNNPNGPIEAITLKCTLWGRDVEVPVDHFGNMNIDNNDRSPYQLTFWLKGQYKPDDSLLAKVAKVSQRLGLIRGQMPEAQPAQAPALEV